jgi:hypothetical protein
MTMANEVIHEKTVEIFEEISENQFASNLLDQLDELEKDHIKEQKIRKQQPQVKPQNENGFSILTFLLIILIAFLFADMVFCAGIFYLMQQ